MALAILDGTQTATTLSSVVTGGEHIVAHSVVSLGSNAISNIATAVSGSTVCVGNLGLLQSTVATEGLPASGSFIKIGGHTGTSTTGNIVHVSAVGALRVDGSAYTQPISGTVTVGTLPSLASNTDFVLVGEYLAEGMNNYGVIGVQVSNSSVTIGNSVTIGSLPAISGTVTANLAGSFNGAIETINDFANVSHAVAIHMYDGDGSLIGVQGNPFSISGSVAIASALLAGTAQIGSVTASISNSVTIASLPAISGTVTANSSNGSLTTRFGSVTTANTAFATSAVTNANRKYLLIQNVTTASNVITVGIGFTPTTTQGIQLPSGAGLTFEGSYIPTGAVNLLSSVTASCFTILEA